MRLRNLALVLFTCLSLNPSFALISPLDFVTRNDFGLVDDLTDIVVRNEYAYLTSNSFLNQGGLAVFDVSDPSEIKISEAIRDSDDAFNIVFVSNTAYVGQSDAFSVYDVTDPTSVVELGKARRSGSQFSNLFGTVKVAASGTKVFAASRSTSVVSAYEASDPENISELGSVSDDSEGGSATHLSSPDNIFVKGNYLIVENDNSSSSADDDGITVLDISDASNIREVDYIAVSGLHRMVVDDNDAYVTYFSDGAYNLKVFDVTNPANISELNQASLSSFGFTSSGFSDFFVSDDRLYYTSSSTFGIFDISDFSALNLIESISDSDADEDDLRITSLGGIFAEGETIYTYSNSSNNKEEAFSTFNFDEPEETVPPEVSTLSPAHEETNTDLAQDFSILFNEPIQKGSGRIFIQNTSKQTIESIEIDSSKITVTGSEATINPDSDFSDQTQLSIVVESGAFVDLANNLFEGISSRTWMFSNGDSIEDTSFTARVDSEFTIVKGGSRKLDIYLSRDEDTQAKLQCTLRNNFSNKAKKFAFKANFAHKNLKFKISRKIAKAVDKSGGEGVTLSLDFTCGSETLTREVLVN